MKKTISLFLTFIMLLSMLPMATFAEELNSPSFTIDSVDATPGDTVSVNIGLKNNPGFITAAINVAFDDGLVLIDATGGDAFPAYMQVTKPPQLLEGRGVTGNCNFGWMSSSGSILDSDIKDGTILTLTFRVSDSSEIGDVYSITISSKSGQFRDKNLQAVDMENVQSRISIIDYTPGDVNDDGSIDMLDPILIVRYIVDAEGYAVSLNEKAADVDDDASITMLDAIMIVRYIVDAEGYKIVLKPSTKRCQHEMQATEAKDATCTEDGNIAYWYCSLCDKYFSDANGSHVISLENTVLKATGHTVVTDPAVPATNNSTGLTEGSHCSVCGMVFREQQVVPIIEPDTANITYKLVNNDAFLASQTIDNSSNPTKYVIGEGVSYFEKIDTVPGYTFVGWFDGFADNATEIKSISASESRNYTLYAHWQVEPFDINFETDSKLQTLLPIPAETYTVNKEKVLPSPKLPGYSFVGWSDDEGNIIRRIPVGTTGDKVYSANWLSDRNQARTKKNVGDPIILEEDNKILFAYEIGEIRNVPVSVISDFGHIVFGGVTKEETVTHSKTVSASEVQAYAKTVANATTENHGITLSNGWSKGMSVDREYYEENGQWDETLNSIAKNETENWNISSGSSGSTSTVKYDSAQETDMNTSTKNKSNTGGRSTSVQDTHTSENHKDVSLNESLEAEYKLNCIVEELDVKGSFSSTQSWGSSESDTHAFGQTFNTSGTVTNGNENQKGKVTHTGSDTTTTGSWNSQSSRGGSNSVTTTEANTKRISKLTSERTNYGETYIGTESEAYYTEQSSTITEADSYSTGTTYSAAETEEYTEKISTTNTMTGYHRWVWATTAHVFLVVGYDIATSSYFVCDYSILDEDVKRFEDYSYDNSSFDDNQTGVISFEIPTEIRDYVADRVSGSSGLQYSRDGKVTGYTGSDDFVIIPEYKVINGTVIKVTGIAENAFKGKVNLPETQVTNSEGELETITPKLTAIQLSDYITEIQDNAFSGCSALQYIDCSNVTRIGNNAFAGCTGLKVARISDKVTSLGENAFDGLTGIIAKTANKNVAEAVVNSGAKVIALFVSDKCDDLENVTLSVPQGTEFFGFVGSLEEIKTFNNVSIVSNAEKTEIANAKFVSTTGTPLQLSSQDIVLAEVEADALNFAMISMSSYANLNLYGESRLTSSKGKAILTKNLVLNGLEDELYSQLYVDGNLMVCGAVEQNNMLSLVNGTVVSLNEDDFQKYLRGTYTITYDPNGGWVNVSETDRVVYIGTQIDALPTPSRDHYIFDGWYVENSSTPVTPETLLNNTEDITLVAHWTIVPYKVSWSTGTGYTISVRRTSSPNAGASIGALSSGANVYYGDVLSVTYTASTGYSITSNGVSTITVSGNITSSSIYATAKVNSYKYNIVYKSINGTSLGTSSATNNYGTTNTISAPAITGYNTPSSQSIKWDSTSAKTITFTYSPKSVDSQQHIKSGSWWEKNGATRLTYDVYAHYRNRTANSVQIQVQFNNTLSANYYYGYSQYFNASMGGSSYEDYWITNGWSSSSSSARTESGYSDWVTVSVSPTTTSVGIDGSWWDNNGKSGYWSGSVSIPTY